MNILDVVIGNLKTELKFVKNYWYGNRKPGFCRIEGGIYRNLFIDTWSMIDPATQIERLPINKTKKKEIKNQYSNLKVGDLMVIYDSDSEENRIGNFRII